MLKSLIFAAVLFVSVFVCVCDAADTTVEGTLFEQTKKSAEEGNAESQYKLAEMYYEGKTDQRVQDYAEAFKWCKKAAEQGNKRAQSMVGWMYFLGQGVKRDYDEAFKCCKKAVEQGYSDALWMLGILYMGKENYNEAIKCLRKAADLELEKRGYSGYAKSLLDTFLPFEKIKKSAEAGDAESQYKLAKMYGPTYNEPEDYIIYDYTKAEKWYKKAAEQGHAEACCFLGRIYFYGYHGSGYTGKPDYAEAVKWYKKAEENGDNYAGTEYKLGDLYYYGAERYEGVEQNYAEALKWYMKALENGIENVDNFEYGHLPLRSDVVSKIGAIKKLLDETNKSNN